MAVHIQTDSINHFYWISAFQTSQSFLFPESGRQTMHLPGQLMAVENLDVLPLDFYDALFLQIGQDSEKGELLNAERVGYLLP